MSVPVRQGLLSPDMIQAILESDKDLAEMLRREAEQLHRAVEVELNIAIEKQEEETN